MATLGENVCVKIKQIYFYDKPWPSCYRDVAQKFTQLKAIARKFYSTDTKDFYSEMKMLQELNKYSIDDIKEAFEN